MPKASGEVSSSRGHKLGRTALSVPREEGYEPRAKARGEMPSSRGCKLGQAPLSVPSEEGHEPPRTIRLSGPLEHDNIVNGYGLRAVLWTQGCHRHCEGCQNPETWDFNGGFEVSVDEIKQRLSKFKGQAGITFCGGEPFEQPEACLEIAKFCKKELGWNVWSFSGYTYEMLKKLGGTKWELVKELDALIDGPFILKERDLTLKFRGSRNQRLLHLKNGEITKIE